MNGYSILNGAKYFYLERLQNYLVFISTRLINLISTDGSDRETESWGSTGMSQETSKNQYISEITFAQKLIDNYQVSRVGFKEIWL